MISFLLKQRRHLNYFEVKSAGFFFLGGGRGLQSRRGHRYFLRLFSIIHIILEHSRRDKQLFSLLTRFPAIGRRGLHVISHSRFPKIHPKSYDIASHSFFSSNDDYSILLGIVSNYRQRIFALITVTRHNL
jgi:hypothetical protein